jgi:hypothetical protein
MSAVGSNGQLQETGERFSWAIKPDAQSFDEIRLRIVPRYKTSDLSGDEWRISVVTEYYRKGTIIHTTQSGSDMQVAAGLLFGRLVEAQDNGIGYFAGDGVHCDQEGCNNKATVVYKIIQRWCVGGGNCGQKKESYGDQHRCFCDTHKQRGDCDLEDNDKNYELVKTL